jgi:hypothetical protein
MKVPLLLIEVTAQSIKVPIQSIKVTLPLIEVPIRTIDFVIFHRCSSPVPLPVLSSFVPFVSFVFLVASPQLPGRVANPPYGLFPRFHFNPSNFPFSSYPCHPSYPWLSVVAFPLHAFCKLTLFGASIE